MDDSLPFAKWLKYIESQLSWTRGNLDNASYIAFMRAGSLGVDGATAFAEVANRIRQAGDHPPESKLKQQIRRAYEYARQDASKLNNLALARSKQTKAVFEREKLEQFAGRLDFEVTPEWLAARSPVIPWNRSPAGILHKLFRTGEKIVVFTDQRTQGEFLWEHLGPGGDLAALNHFQAGQKGVWFLVQPVDGLEHFNPRQNTISRRSEESVTAWRYALLESDEAPRELWLKALVQLPLPIASITDSGGKSIHTLIRVNARSKEEWDGIIRARSLPALIVLGACPQAPTAIRLTRLGNCERAEKGKLQRLLYLNPEPDDTPLCQKPLREAPEATGTRFNSALINHSELSRPAALNRASEELYVR